MYNAPVCDIINLGERDENVKDARDKNTADIAICIHHFLGQQTHMSRKAHRTTIK
jgi:hypothetical protein